MLELDKFYQIWYKERKYSGHHLKKAEARQRVMKVLVVDDVDLNLRLVKAAVRDLCTDILTASRATEAIELAIAHNPDLIFMDIGLPDFDGLEASTIIRNNPVTCKTPIVIVSAHALPDYVEKAKAFGCDTYLTKPVTVSALREVVLRYRGRPAAIVPKVVPIQSSNEPSLAAIL